MANDLLFRGAPLLGQPVELVFGDEGDDVSIPDRTASFTGTLPDLAGAVPVQVVVRASFTGVLPDLAGSVAGQYVSGASRPLVNETRATWQRGTAAEAGLRSAYSDGVAAPVSMRVRWRAAQPTAAAVNARWQDASGVYASVRARLDAALRVHADPVRAQFQQAQRAAAAVLSRYAVALAVHGEAVGVAYQDGGRGAREAIRARYQAAIAVAAGAATSGGRAQTRHHQVHTRYQEAMRPPVGISHVVVPPVDPCYVPPHGLAVELLFADEWDGSSHLVFVCERHGANPEPPAASVVVPIRKVYFVINNVSLQIAAGGMPLLATELSMSLDSDSWTWSWSATVGAAAEGLLESIMNGEPVDLLATVNGNPFRLLAERIGRDRAHPTTRIRIGGRGRAAMLDAPHAPSMLFGNSLAATAQQLMEAALTANGVGLGWDIDFGLEDWLVPAGAWSHQGSWRSAVSAIAAAAGGYVQPHPTDATLRVLPLYPHAPWAWSSVTPDLELPVQATAREGIEWTTKPSYNRVFVSGVGAGVLGQVTRAGTAGDLVAPMVTEALIGDAVAARQRGVAVLADTGPQALVSVTLQVLPETGVIHPGTFVRYLDGGRVHLGLVRSTAISWARPALRQTIGVQTHVQPV